MTFSPQRSHETTRERHDQLIHMYREHYTANNSLSESDQVELVTQHEFVRDDDADEKRAYEWGVRMARKYYTKLFKEYAIVDLQLYKSGRVGMRWRIEREVITGKGQFVCGSKHCQSVTNLHSYEVPFRYVEHGNAKNELVKVRVCLDCAKKLFYEKLLRLTAQTQQEQQSDHKNKGKGKSRQTVEEHSLHQQMSHDDIVCALFDIGTAAECKEDDDVEADGRSAKRARTTTLKDDDDDNSAESDRLLKMLMP